MMLQASAMLKVYNYRPPLSTPELLVHARRAPHLRMCPHALRTAQFLTVWAPILISIMQCANYHSTRHDLEVIFYKEQACRGLYSTLPSSYGSQSKVSSSPYPSLTSRPTSSQVCHGSAWLGTFNFEMRSFMIRLHHVPT